MNVFIKGKAIKIMPDIANYSSNKNASMSAQASEKDVSLECLEMIFSLNFKNLEVLEAPKFFFSDGVNVPSYFYRRQFCRV